MSRARARAAAGRATPAGVSQDPGRRRPDHVGSGGPDHERRRPGPHFPCSGVRRPGRRGDVPLGVDTLDRILHVRALDREIGDQDHEQQEPSEGDGA